MTITNNFKKGLDRSPWRPEAVLPVAAGAGTAFAYDMRNDATKQPTAWFLRTAANIDAFNTHSGDWGIGQQYNPGLSAVGAGSTMVYHPSQGPGVGNITGSGSIGTISAGTTTSVTLSTALATAVGTNQLANRGDGTGFRMRIIGMSGGGSGKTEEVTITKNTSGTQPVVTWVGALTFTPQNGDGYEILSGKLYCLGTGTLAAGTWKSVDIATGTITALSNTNLAATITTDSFALAMAEVYVPNERNPGDGFIDTNSTYNNTVGKCCVATASSGTTLTSAALVNPSSPSLATNEYRNFQLRIVEDTGTPTAVGQRRIITSHTSGTTPVFTVPTFTVTPSATAKFVIELPNDRIFLRSSATTNMYNYAIGGNAWDASTTWTAGGTANANGLMMAPCWGLTRDATGNRLQGQIFVFRGGASSTLDLFDMTAGATGAWTGGVTFGFSTPMLPTTGWCGAYDPATLGGRYFHVAAPVSSSFQRMYRFDVLAQTMEIGTMLAYPGGSLTVGQRMFVDFVIDGSTKMAMLYSATSSQTQMFSQLVPF